MEIHHLPSFCLFLQGENVSSSLGEVRCLSFYDAFFSRSHLSQEPVLTRAELISLGLGFKSESQRQMLQFVDRITLLEAASDLLDLHPLATGREKKKAQGFTLFTDQSRIEGFYQLVVSRARFLILQSLPRIETLSIHGSELPFTWGKIGEGLRLSAFSSLKELNIKSLRYPSADFEPVSYYPPSISCKDVLTIFKFPLLLKASLYVRLNEQDFNFLDRYPNGSKW